MLALAAAGVAAGHDAILTIDGQNFHIEPDWGKACL
jgi:hypothetical protein